MIIVNYADFMSDTAKYIKEAKVQGIKIKPERQKKFSRRQQRNFNALHAVRGLVPADIDFDAVKTEELLHR